MPSHLELETVAKKQGKQAVYNALNIALYYKQEEQIKNETLLRRVNFQIDGFDGVFPGYWGGDRWNGWACPFFTDEQVQTILKAIPAEPYGKWVTQFVVPSGAYAFAWTEKGHEDKAEWNYFTPNSRLTEDGELTLYSIGGWSWCWNLTTDWGYNPELES